MIGTVAESSSPERALAALSELLRDDDTVISAHVRVPEAPPALGLLAAAGPRSAAARFDYALLVECAREGYLLHYSEPRLAVGADPDLRLLAGDYLYALGLERLAALGDVESVRELSDLISLSAQAHAEGTAAASSIPLWLAAIAAIAAGGRELHEEAKAALRERRPEAPELLLASAASAAREAGIVARLRSTGEAIGFPGTDLDRLG